MPLRPSRFFSTATLAAAITAFAMACDRAPAPPVSDVAGDTTAVADTTAGPPPHRWLLSADAFGPMRIGMRRQGIASLVPGAFDVPAPPEPGGCVYASWDQAPRGMRFMFAGDTLVRIEADSGQVQTVLGARVGDTEARIDSLYGPRVRRLPHKYTSGSYLIAFSRPPVDTLHRIVFETDSATAKVTKLRVGRLPEAEWVEGCS